MLTEKLQKSLNDYLFNKYSDINTVSKVYSEFEETFSKLDKYDQLDLSFYMEANNWDVTFEMLQRMTNQEQ